eukprot:scaffold38005_cov153-Amphora_coffeaeformis.AAC.1
MSPKSFSGNPTIMAGKIVPHFRIGSARRPELFWPLGVRQSWDGYARHPKLRMAVEVQKSGL